MNDQELRQIVRQAIARNLGVQGPGSRVQGPPPSRVQGPPQFSVQSPESRGQSVVQFVPETVPFGSHASHSMYLQLVNSSSACVIEERVQCDHCGYCKSHGH